METTQTANLSPFAAGQNVGILSGCRARDINKGDGARIDSITDFERGVVRVALRFHRSGRVISFYCHRNRLADLNPTLNDGNPTHKITLTRTAYGTVRLSAR